MLDDELRLQLADWVRPVITLPVPDIRVLRRRARRRGVRRTATAAAITAVVAAVAVGVVASLPGTGRPAGGRPVPTSPSWPAAPGTWTHGIWRSAGPLPAADASPATAPYAVMVVPGRGTLQVRNVFTGKIMATVRPPHGQYLGGIAAAGDDRTFVVVAQKGGRMPLQPPPQKPTPMSAVFYELRLKPDGQPGSLGLLFSLPTNFMPTFAISPDASMLAYTTNDSGFETVSLPTGTGRAWAPVDAGTVAPYSLSWAGDRRLAFLWATGNNPHPPGIGIRVLDVAAPGTLLQASRLISRYGRFCAAFGVCRDDLLVTPDGSKVLVTKEVSSGGDTTASIEEISADTGQAMTTVAPPDSSLTPGPLCEPLWADPSGQQVMTYCGHGERYDNGYVSPADLHFPFDILNFGTGSNAFAW